MFSFVGFLELLLDLQTKVAVIVQRFADSSSSVFI